MPVTHPEALREILTDTRTIALLGASEKPERASNGVMAFLQSRGYRVIPVNPRLAGTRLFEETVYRDIASIPDDITIDMVDVFLDPGRTDPIIDAAIERGAKVIWLQLGVINEDGAERAEAAGLTVVMDRCPKIEIPRLGIPVVK